MTDIHINEFLMGRTQAEVAEIMGVTQGSVSQMIKAERDIYFREGESGKFSFYEIKRTRRKKAA